jgi:hypothetical protein
MKRNRANGKEQSRLFELRNVLALAILVLIIVTASCKKRESANSNNEDNSNQEASNASPSPGASAETPQPSPATAAFDGTWVNKDTATRNIPRLIISQTGTEAKVHAFGKCSPKDCDWGEETGGIIDNSVVLTWDQKFVIRKMTLTLQGNELKCVTESVYNDNRPRRRTEEVFVKQS